MSLTAKITTVKIGSIEIEGLMFEDGSYGIALQQIANMFSVLPKSVQKWVEARLGKGFQFFQCKTDRQKQAGKQNRAENTLTIIQFEKLLRKLDREGNVLAQSLVDDLVGLTLSQLFADAFEVKFEKEERQAYLIARQQGKIDRLKLTDGIKKYMESNEISNGSKWFGGCSQNTYLALFGMTKSALLKNRGVEDKADLTPRDYMSADELKKLAEFENFAAILMVKENTEPFKAVQKAKEFYN